MGTWNVDSFANDDAADWLTQFQKVASVHILKDALSLVIGSEEYLELPACNIAIAAAEVVAAIRTPPSQNLPKSVHEFIGRVEQRDIESLTKMARSAVEKIMKCSELQELWDEGANSFQWHQAMDALLLKLNAEKEDGQN